MVYITLLGLFIGTVDVRRLLQSTNNPSFIAECGAAIGIAYETLGSEGARMYTCFHFRHGIPCTNASLSFAVAPELSDLLGGCFRLGFAIKYQIWSVEHLHFNVSLQRFGH